MPPLSRRGPVSGLTSRGNYFSFDDRLPMSTHSGMKAVELVYRCGGSAGLVAHSNIARRTGFPFKLPVE